jgi:peptide/nickel transport system permease protein
MSEMATTDDPAIAGPSSAATHRTWPAPGRLLLGVGLAMLAILVLVTLLAPLLAPYDPSAT